MKVIKEWKFKPTDDMTVPQYHIYQLWCREQRKGRIDHYADFKLWQLEDSFYWYKIPPPPKEIEKFIEIEYVEVPDKPTLKDIPWYKKLFRL